MGGVKFMGQWLDGSPEWLHLREGRVGGSDIGAIIGHGYITREQLLDEKRNGNSKNSETLRRGHYAEPYLRAWLAGEKGVAVDGAKRGTYHGDDYAVINPDDITTDGRLVEYKCHSTRDAFGRAGTSQVPARHLAQVTAPATGPRGRHDRHASLVAACTDRLHGRRGGPTPTQGCVPKPYGPDRRTRKDPTMTDPIQVLDEWIADDGYGSRGELISRLQRAQDDAQDYEEAAESAALETARANSQRDQLRSRIAAVEVLAERALSHGYDLDPQDVLDELKTKGDN